MYDREELQAKARDVAKAIRIGKLRNTYLNLLNELLKNCNDENPFDEFDFLVFDMYKQQPQAE